VGFEVISISRDDDLEAWKKAIEKDSIVIFQNASTKLNEYAALLDQFFVWSIPVKILIDRTGKIVARWRGGGEANKQEMVKVIQELGNFRQ
jgi:hypothetical protein